MGPDAVDVLLSFAIKETQCAKGSAGNLQDCAFRPGFFVVRHFKAESQTFLKSESFMGYWKGNQLASLLFSVAY